MSHIFVTGGAGYLGATLIPILLGAGHSVTALDAFLYDPPTSLSPHPNLKIVHGSVENTPLLKVLLPEHDVVIPLACLVGAPLCDRYPEQAKIINRHHVFVCCEHAHTDAKIIFPATNSVYGAFDRPCTEEMTVRPLSHYARLKVEAEQMVLDRGTAISLRFGTLFGFSPRMRTDLLVNDFVWHAMTHKSLVLYEPNFKRSVLHVRDAATAIVHALDHFDAMSVRNRNVYNAACASPTKREIAVMIAERLARRLPIYYVTTGNDPDKRNCEVDCSRLLATGWKPDYSLSDGIDELIRGFPMISGRRFGNV